MEELLKTGEGSEARDEQEERLCSMRHISLGFRHFPTYQRCLTLFLLPRPLELCHVLSQIHSSSGHSWVGMWASRA